MAVPEGGLQPMIGFAMQQLGIRDGNVEAVRERMLIEARQRGWPASLIDQAISWAESNRRATLRAQTTGHESSLASALGKIVPTAESVGVRVVLTVQTQRPGQPIRLETASVVLNVAPDVTPDQAVEAAIEFWNSGQAHQGKRAYGGSKAKAGAVLAVFEGGYERTSG